MSSIDLGGLVVSVAIGSLIAALGVGIDGLLLNRHVKFVDELSLRWWFFFDSLRIADIPRVAVSFYIRGKNKILGSGFNINFLIRTFIVSLILTTISVPGGRALGLYLLMRCIKFQDPNFRILSIDQIIHASWGWTGQRVLTYLVPVNILFDLLTIFITIIILSRALLKSDYFLISLILLDIIACFILFYNAIFIADQFDNASMVSVNGYWNIIQSMVEVTSFGCPAYHMLTSKLLFVSTIILPTLIYLIMIVGLFLLREGFKLFKFIAMYILEKSVEDKKTIFAHLGTSIGLFVAVGKLCLEIFKSV